MSIIITNRINVLKSRYMEEIEMKDISQLSHSQQEEIAGYIKRDNLETVNKNVVEIIPKKHFIQNMVKEY